MMEMKLQQFGFRPYRFRKTDTGPRLWRDIVTPLGSRQEYLGGTFP